MMVNATLLACKLLQMHTTSESLLFPPSFSIDSDALADGSQAYPKHTGEKTLEKYILLTNFNYIPVGELTFQA